MKKLNHSRIFTRAFLFAFIICFIFVSYAQAASPVSLYDENSSDQLLSDGEFEDESTTVSESQDLIELELTEFVKTLTAGQGSMPVGVYVPNTMAVPITQQGGNAAYVTSKDNEVTHFGLTSKYGSIGLIAHNYLSGSLFFDLQVGQDVFIVYGDGKIEHYRVTGIQEYQALSPNSPYSDFINLYDSSQTTMSANDLFFTVYDNPGTVVFQTCIRQGDLSTWGRLFVSAELQS